MLVGMPAMYQWHLEKLMHAIKRADHIASGFRFQAFYFVGDTTYELLYDGTSFNVVGKTDLLRAKIYRDMWFTRPHIAVRVQMYEGDTLIVFYADDFNRLKTWLKEMLPDVNSVTTTEGLLAGCLLMDGAIHPPT